MFPSLSFITSIFVKYLLRWGRRNVPFLLLSPSLSTADNCFCKIKRTNDFGKLTEWEPTGCFSFFLVLLQKSLTDLLMYRGLTEPRRIDAAAIHAGGARRRGRHIIAFAQCLPPFFLLAAAGAEEEEEEDDEEDDDDEPAALFPLDLSFLLLLLFFASPAAVLVVFFASPLADDPAPAPADVAEGVGLAAVRAAFFRGCSPRLTKPSVCVLNAELN